MVDITTMNKIAVMDVMIKVGFRWELMPRTSSLKFDPVSKNVCVVNQLGERMSMPRKCAEMLSVFSKAAISLLAVDRGVKPVIITEEDYHNHCMEVGSTKVETPTLESNLQEIERILAENADFSRKITENNQKLVKLRENLSKRLKNAGILNEKCNVYGTGYYPNSICYGSKQTRF